MKTNWELLYKKMHNLNLSKKEQEVVKNNILKKDA